jgi:O-antigen/teichoic acid export membrane protein
LAQEGVWITVGQILSVVASLVLVRVLTEYLDPVQYGQIALGLTIVGLVEQVTMSGLSAGINRFYSVATEKGDLGGYLNASRYLVSCATVVICIAAPVFLVLLAVGSGASLVAFAAVTIVFSLLNSYTGMLNGIQNAARKRATVAFHSALDVWLKVLFSVGMIQWFGASSIAVVGAYLLSSLVVTGSQVLFLRRLLPRQIEWRADRRPWVTQMWAYAWPFSTWGIFTWAQQSSDRWALEAFSSTENVGLYAVLFQLGYAPVAMATSMAVQFIGPILFQRSGDAGSESRNRGVRILVWRITLIFLAFTVLGFVAAFAMHEWVFRLLVAAEFRSVSYLLPWVVLAGGLFATAQMLSVKLMSDLRPAAMIWVKIVTALLGVGLNVYGASVAGADGVVFALVIFSAVYLVWMSYLSSPRSRTTPAAAVGQQK